MTEGKRRMQARKRPLTYACWAAVLLAPLVSVLLVCLATDSSLLELDAWNTKWNDELFYNRVIRQMHDVGQPTGVAGYNEVPAKMPSYGTYSVVIYLPYFLGSFVTGWASHNFMYAVNALFTVLACLVVIAVMRPGIGESLVLAVAVAFQFVATRLAISGMTEASYVLFAAIFGACAVYATDNIVLRGAKRRLAVAFAVMILACGFWGAMRPYILALMVVVWFQLWRSRRSFSAFSGGGLLLLSIAVAIASMAVYLYSSKYYAAPYFGGTTFGDTLLSDIGAALPSLAHEHVSWVAYAFDSIAHARRQGVMMLVFLVEIVFLVALLVKARRSGKKEQASLFAAFLLAGLAILEAHLLIYTYQQMHRTLMCICVVYFIAIVHYGGSLRSDGKPVAQAGFAIALSAICAACLVTHASEFAYPQSGEPSVDDATVKAQLEEAMPWSEEAWDNTVAHAIETKDLYLLFSLPAYLNTNTIKGDMLKDKIAADSFKSKYLCVRSDFKSVKQLRKRYSVIYEGCGHIIFQLRN